LSRRNKRSISLRRRCPAFLSAHRSKRRECGGTIGMNSRSRTSCRVSLPPYAASMTGPQRLGSLVRRHWIAACRRVTRLARRQEERYGAPSIRGNHMNVGCPSAPHVSDGLRAVVYSALMPSGSAVTIVLSRPMASIRTRSSC
jgi:hypothetical protein